MNLEIKIVRENGVFELLNDKTFIKQWEELADQNEKVTVIQERPYVITWYSQYSNKYQPILVLGLENDSELVGFMPLALSIKDNYLVHAGNGQAEYHGWLCRKDAEQDFPIQALIAVKKSFKLRKWQWRPIPPRSQVSWLHSDILKKANIYVRIVETESPVLDLNDENRINKIIRNKSTRNLINRYTKRNGFYLERIKSKEKAQKVFDILSVQCDFRQMAAHKNTPFASDGNKKHFYIERMNFPENNHFTILWADNNPVAYHFGACDSNTVYLGLAAYDPLEEKNSPGTILMVKLMELLKNEGFRFLDLTPGGDKYKEHFSSFYQILYIPTIYFIKRDKLFADFKDIIRKTTKNLISSTGAKPKIVKSRLDNALKEAKKIWKTITSGNLKKTISIFYERKVYLLYKFSINGISLNDFQNHENIAVNKYSDLLLYNDSRQDLKKSELLSVALKRFATKDLLFSLILNDTLVQYGWMTSEGGNHRFTNFDIKLDYPENSCLLYDFFTEPGFSKPELFKKILEKMLIECVSNGVSDVFTWITEDSVTDRIITETAGFRIYRIFIVTKTPWHINSKEKLLKNQ